MQSDEKITFSFGKNWQAFLSSADQQSVASAMNDIQAWIPSQAVIGKRVLDIGSGSGIHSLCFHRLGPENLTSFDYDPHSVAATRSLWTKAGQPADWSVSAGSILDDELVQKLGKFDIVYSWGVLHHTGSMWKAIENASQLVAGGGLFWIALYTKGPRYDQDLKLKKRYNRSGTLGKRWMEFLWILKVMLSRLKRFKNPFAWNHRNTRGMVIYNDIVDWLGGLPYEVASQEEVTEFCQSRGFRLLKIEKVAEGGCSSYLFERLQD